MTDTDVRQRFAALEEDLGTARVHRFEAMDPYPGGRRTSKALATALGHPAPPDLAALYEAVDGLSLWWHASAPDRPVASAGSIEITASDGLGATIADARTRLPDATGTPVVFDTGSHFHAVVAEVAPEATALWLVLPDGRAARLPLSPEAYVALAVRVGGIAGWAFRTSPEALALLDGLSNDRLPERAAAFVPGALDALGLAPPDAGARTLRYRPLLEAAEAAGADVHTAPPATTPAIRWAETVVGSRIPAGLLAVLEETNGVDLSWSEAGRTGGFRIEPLERMVGGPQWAQRPSEVYTAAEALSLPDSSALNDWLAFYQAEEQFVGVQFAPARLAVADRDGVRPLSVPIDAFVEAAIQHGGDPDWLRSLEGGAPPAPRFSPGA